MFKTMEHLEKLCSVYGGHAAHVFEELRIHRENGKVSV